MVVMQGDLFWGLDSSFVKQIMNESEKATWNEGDVLFSEGDLAHHFYVLLKGRIKLSKGDVGPTVFIAKDPGHVVGWSTLVGRETYSATAAVVEPSTLIKMNRDSFLEKLSELPESEALFFKRVAEMLGQRLVAVYPSVA